MSAVTAGTMALLVACGGGGDAAAPTSSALTLSKPVSYVLKWSDDFTNSGAPGDAWKFDFGSPELDGGGVWGNKERQFYTDDPTNVFVSQGLLTIQPSLIDPTIAPKREPTILATSSRLKTDSDLYYAALNGTPYGYYEIRAKVPCVEGAWPAIWMMGKDGVWPERGEVDIMEWFGAFFTGKPDQVQSAVHTKNKSGKNAPSGNQDVSTMCKDFQRFQLHWTANEIVIGVNDKPTFSYKKPLNAPIADWPFDQQAYLILNVAVGGNLGGYVNTEMLPRMKMEVDYVRVWQQP